MNKLKCRSITCFEVNHNDLDAFILSVYGQNFESAASEDWNKYSHHLIPVFKEKLTEYRMKQLENFKKDGSGHYVLRFLLGDLVNRELIPEGDYLISVF